MGKHEGNLFMLAEAEEEMRRAVLAEKAGIKGASVRRQKAEISVDRWRARCRATNGKVSEDFGPGERP